MLGPGGISLAFIVLLLTKRLASEFLAKVPLDGVFGIDPWVFGIDSRLNTLGFYLLAVLGMKFSFFESVKLRFILVSGLTLRSSLLLNLLVKTRFTSGDWAEFRAEFYWLTSPGFDC